MVHTWKCFIFTPVRMTSESLIYKDNFSWTNAFCPINNTKLNFGPGNSPANIHYFTLMDSKQEVKPNIERGQYYFFWRDSTGFLENSHFCRCKDASTLGLWALVWSVTSNGLVREKAPSLLDHLHILTTINSMDRDSTIWGWGNIPRLLHGAPCDSDKHGRCS